MVNRWNMLEWQSGHVCTCSLIQRRIPFPPECDIIYWNNLKWTNSGPTVFDTLNQKNRWWTCRVRVLSCVARNQSASDETWFVDTLTDVHCNLLDLIIYLTYLIQLKTTWDILGYLLLENISDGGRPGGWMNGNLQPPAEFDWEVSVWRFCSR